MFNVTMTYLPDMEHFSKIVEESSGDVLLHLPDQTLCDLKRDHAAMQLLRLTAPSQEGLKVSLSDPSDAPAFLQYMMEAGQD